MRGSPPLQLLFVALGLLAFAWPLHRLTAGRDGAPGAGSSMAGKVKAADDSVKATVFVRFAHRPESVEILQGPASLWKAERPENSPVEVPVTISIHDEAAELTVRATWPAGSPETAIGLTVEPDGHEGRESTVWSVDGSVDRVVAFQWK